MKQFKWNSIGRFVIVMTACWVFLSLASVSPAQDDFDRMFEQMMKEYFPRDLLKEIESIREKKPSREDGSFYKSNPEVREIRVNQLRARRKDRVEKQHPENLAPFRPLSQKLCRSVVAVFRKGEPKQLALATAVSNDGYLVTKASELDDLKEVECVRSNSVKFDARVVRVDKTNDLALLKTDENLTPIEMEGTPMEEGTLLITVNNSQQPVAMGTLAVKPRSIIGNNRGFLGVEPGPHPRGVLLKDVTDRSAAQRAGLKPGDIVLQINGVATGTVAELVREIASRKKGQAIELKVERSGSSVTIKATLDGRMMRGDRAARFEMMRNLGAVPSERHSEFPNVIQHDTPILPNQCGSPIVDLDGRVIGINIARSGRTSSFAIPVKMVKRMLDNSKQ